MHRRALNFNFYFRKTKVYAHFYFKIEFLRSDKIDGGYEHFGNICKPINKITGTIMMFSSGNKYS